VFNRQLTSQEKRTEEVTIQFPRNEDLLDDNFRSFTAVVVAWCWDKSSLEKTPEYRRRPTQMRYDLAVLYIKDIPIELEQALAKTAKELLFIKGHINNVEFSSWVQDPNDGSLSRNVSGSFGDADPASGTVVMKPGLIPDSFFFDSGSSGAPIYCEVAIGDQTIDGVAGFADFLIAREGKAEARMLHAMNIHRLLDLSYPSLKLNYIDLAETRAREEDKKTQLKIDQLYSRIYADRGEELRCDRLPQVEQAKDRVNKAKSGNGGSKDRFLSFLIYGSKGQRLNDFVYRYCWEFLVPEGKDSIVRGFQVPRLSEKPVFAGNLVGNILSAFNRPNLFADLPAELLTIERVIDAIRLDDESFYVLEFQVDCEKFAPENIDSFTWLLNNFLAPLKYREAFSRIQVFFSFYYTAIASFEANRQAIFAQFGRIDLPELASIPWSEVERWLDGIPGELPVKEHVKSIFVRQETYDMEEIQAYYKQALAQVKPK